MRGDDEEVADLGDARRGAPACHEDEGVAVVASRGLRAGVRRPDRRIHLVGAGRTELSDAQWRRRVRDAFREAGAEDAFASVASTPYLAVDATTAPGLRRVIEDAPGAYVKAH